MGPLDVHRPQLQLHIFSFTEKKIREEVSSHFTICSRRQALISLGRADLESVRGSGEGDSSLPCVINSIIGLLDGDGLDEIYHVIKLVLLGFDP